MDAKIKEYRVSWEMKNNKGSMKFLLVGASKWSSWKTFKDKTDFLITLMILQSGEDAFLQKDSLSGELHIYTGPEKPGT